MASNIEIAQKTTLKPIQEVAAGLGIPDSELELYGKYKAKVPLDTGERYGREGNGKLILVTALTPTPAGEGKTTTTVGLGQALHRAGRKACICVREPSMGPVFGNKGGGAGGGYSQVMPMDDINLHFTGDIHAVTSAHNLMLALLDNHLHHGNALGINPLTITTKRAVDMCDRALRNIVCGLGGPIHGVPRESGFEITAASEVMAILALATGIDDLKERIGRILLGVTHDGKPVTAGDILAPGPLAVILKDAVKPNLVQTVEGAPAFVHAGPFGNIAHGCSSVMATKTALRLADYVITEAGFGSDLGAEKFFNIKCRVAGLHPDGAVLVATARALKMHGGVPLSKVADPDADAIRRGIENLFAHSENLHQHGLQHVVAVNRRETDTEEELTLIRDLCAERGIKVAVADVYGKGGAGGEVLAQLVEEMVQEPSQYKPLYCATDSLTDKIRTIATKVYRAGDVQFTPQASKRLQAIEAMGYGNLLVCMAKTQNSITDDKAVFGAPCGFTVTVRDVRVSAGAGFVVVYLGDVLTMPGLAVKPAAHDIDIDSAGTISGLF